MSFLLGALPVFLASLAVQVRVFNSAIETMIPYGFGLLYTGALCVACFVYTFVVRIFPPSENPGFISQVLSDVYKEVRVLFRVSAGILLSFSIVWAYDDWATVDWKLLWFVIMGILSLFAATAIATGVQWLENLKAIEP